MNSHILPVSCCILFISVCMACQVEYDRGPFPIRDDMEMIVGKTNYLDSIAAVRPAEDAPNILLILVDDLGKHDISTYDPEGVPTPALDRLASEGVKFNSAYASSPVCSPSRVSLLTGRYQQRFGFERQPMSRYARSRMEYWIVDHLINTDPMQLISPMSAPSKQEMEMQGIPRSEVLLSELLSQRGYKTGIFGKWHMGHHNDFIPNNRGFGEQFGFYEAFTFYTPAATPGMVEHRHDYFASKHIWRQKRKGNCAIRENNTVIEDTEYLTFSIARRACNFMENNRDKPFFMFVPFSAPHTPFQVPLEYYNRFPEEEDHNKRVYYGMISALDDAVGMIVEQLESLDLAENTLIIFASDNGGATYTGATDNGPLKAGKFSQFEGGINIPMIFSWKGHLPGGMENGTPVSLMDIFATSADLAGVTLPGDRTIDGINLLPLLVNPDSIQPNRALFWRCDFNKAIRYGPWKLVWNDRDDQMYLYNLDGDPGEQHNLTSKNSARIKELQLLFDAWESGMKPPRWPGVMEFRFDLDGESTLWAI